MFKVVCPHRLLPVVSLCSLYCIVTRALTHGGITCSEALGECTSTASKMGGVEEIDAEYPGTAVKRMMAARERVGNLTSLDLNGDWDDVRRKLLWAGGLRDLVNVRPGEGYTGHGFNDFNHCDLTTMVGAVSENENKGLVDGIAYHNQLGHGILVASMEELGPGGSWTTCMMGCNSEPPRDVAHLQFRSRIAFKLVWSPAANFKSFVIVDDAGKLLNNGAPTGRLPSMRDRQMNYQTVVGSKYAVEADAVSL